MNALPRPSRGANEQEQEQALTFSWVPPAPDSEAMQDVDDVEKTLWDEKAVGNGVSAPTETETAVVAVA